MIEKRRFHRVRYVSECVLTCHDASHEGRLENLSLNGALASFNGSILVRPANTGTLDVYVDSQAEPLRFEVEVVHGGFSMVGVKFLDMDSGTKVRLQELLRRLTSTPEKFGEKLCG